MLKKQQQHPQELSNTLETINTTLHNYFFLFLSSSMKLADFLLSVSKDFDLDLSK